MCVFRISGTYGSISPWLYYTSLLAGTHTRENEWLAVGIMATVMVYSSAAIVHAWVILFDSDTPLDPAIIGLDIIPITPWLSRLRCYFALSPSTVRRLEEARKRLL